MLPTVRPNRTHFPFDCQGKFSSNFRPSRKSSFPRKIVFILTGFCASPGWGSTGRLFFRSCFSGHFLRIFGTILRNRLGRAGKHNHRENPWFFQRGSTKTASFFVKNTLRNAFRRGEIAPDAPSLKSIENTWFLQRSLPECIKTNGLYIIDVHR